MRTLTDLLFESERRFGARPALAIRRALRTESWTYHELALAAQRAAARVSAAGVAPGDRVVLQAPNTPELVISMFGVWLAGGVLVPVDARTPVDVMARFCARTTPRLTIASEPPDKFIGMPTISPARLAEPGPIEMTTPPSKVELAELVFTSGTTGTPKGVMLTHANILANVDAAVDAMPFGVGERLLSLLPLSHMMEQTAGLLAPLATGATVFTPPAGGQQP